MSGSSGGPIVNWKNEIVGQLYGDSNGNAEWCVTQSDGTNTYGNYKNIDGEFFTTYTIGNVAEILGTIESCINGESCDDGDPCTENDLCSEGICTGTLITCPDGEVCQNNNCILPNVCSEITKKNECNGDCVWSQGSCV